MSKSIAVIVAMSLLVAYCAAGEEVFDIEDPKVIDADSTSLPGIIKENECFALEFYARWCGYCQRLAPEYEKAAGVLEGEIPLVKIDATKENALAGEYGVRGYPTLKIVKKGQAFDYKGPREADGIVDYLRKKCAPSYTSVSNIDDLETIVADMTTKPVIVAAVGKDGLEGKVGKNVVNFSIKNSDVFDFVFFDGDVAKLVAKYAPEKSGAESCVIAITPEIFFSTANKKNAIKSVTSEVVLRSKWKLQKWISAVTIVNADISVLTSETEETDVFGNLTQPRLRCILDGSQDWSNPAWKKLEDIIAVLEKTEIDGKKLLAAVSFLEDARGLAGEWGIDSISSVGYDCGILVSEELSYTSNYSNTDLAGLIEGYLADSLTPYIKSRAVPESEQAVGVVDVTGETFQDLMADWEDKDVFLEAYAVWCGHCKALKPTWEELGDHFDSLDNIVVARIEATQNEVFQLREFVRGFPTLLFKKAGSSDFEKVELQGRTFDDLVQYVDETAVGSTDVADDFE